MDPKLPTYRKGQQPGFVNIYDQICDNMLFIYLLNLCMCSCKGSVLFVKNVCSYFCNHEKITYDCQDINSHKHLVVSCYCSKQKNFGFLLVRWITGYSGFNFVPLHELVTKVITFSGDKDGEVRSDHGHASTQTMAKFVCTKISLHQYVKHDCVYCKIVYQEIKKIWAQTQMITRDSNWQST